MLPGIYEFDWDAGHIIFLGAFYSVLTIVLVTLTIASLRAIWIEPCRLLAVAVNRLPSDASRNEGTASVASTAMIRIVNMRCLPFLPP